MTDCHLYQFIGSSVLEQLFSKYKEKEGGKYLENCCKTFPEGDVRRSMLQMYYRKDGSFQSFGWLTCAGFCYGTYATEVFDKLVHNFTIIPYAKLKKDGSIELDESPVAIAHSEHHIYILYEDCISIISKITTNIVHTEYLYDTLGLTNMYFDRARNCLFLHNSKNLYKLEIDNESRDVWKAYLEKEDYQSAMNHCRQKGLTTYLRRVAKLYGSHLYNKQEFKQAAVVYGESDEKFEEVALKFLVKNQYEALKVYLKSIDKNLPPKNSATQKTLIATWLTEIYLHEMNSTNSSSSYKNLRDNFKAFMKEKNEFLDTLTIYQLLHNYGRTQEFLDFAEMKNDYETVILHYVNEKHFDKAIEKLHSFMKLDKSAKNMKSDLSSSNEQVLYGIFSKYSHIFMKYQPELTIDKLLKHFRGSVDPNKLISAIMNTEESKRDKVADYLEDLIRSKVKDKNIHNLYIFFLSQLNSESSIKKLLYYLQVAFENKNIQFEVDYALKVFSQFKIYSAQALALAIMSKFDEAVKIALDNNYPLIAKKIAKIVEDYKLKKLLWLEIFKHQMQEESAKLKDNPTTDNNEEQQNNFAFAIDLMNESEVLKIEDILPNLMGTIKIEVFKNQITKCIDSYENSIEQLKAKIFDYNDTAKSVKTDISKVKKKYMEIRYQQCICEICNNIIKEDNIYIFPCGHLFDAECLFGQIKHYSISIENLQPKVERLIVLKSEIENYEKRKNASNIASNEDKDDRGTFFTFMGFGNEVKQTKSVAAKRIHISTEELKKLEEMKSHYSDLLSEECVLCGDMIIESIKEPLVSPFSKESWTIL